MRIVFFGSPDYAVPSLRACLDLRDAEVIAVVTQPDRARGRSGAALMTPVKQAAIEAGVATILQPERVRRDTTDVLAALRPDIGVVAASGHILPTHLLEVFPHHVVNVHASLLPRHRGASPVSAAILAGDAESGASIMLVVRELDAGPVLAKAATPIGPLDTTGALVAGPQLQTDETLANKALVDTQHTGLRSNEVVFGEKGRPGDVTVRLGPDKIPPADAAFVTWTLADDSPYFCVEPWMGPANAAEHKVGLYQVAPGQTQKFAVSISVR